MARSEDVYLAIERSMTEEAREKFLATFLRINPTWRGAHVSDVLANLCNVDSHLDVVEPMYEQHAEEVGPELATLIGPSTLAVLYVHGREGVTWERVRNVMDQAWNWRLS